MPMRRVGVLGGSFDPHLGHLVIAAEARWRLGLDEVRLVPARLSPHKPQGAHGTPEQRLHWLREAATGQPGLRVVDDELRRPGPSYTVDTLEAMAAHAADTHLWFIMGTDQLAALGRWHRPERILQLARVAVVPRAGMAEDAIADLIAAVAPGRADVVAAPQIEISSTLIRQRIARGEPIAHLVPPAVARCLEAEGLVPSPRCNG